MNNILTKEPLRVIDGILDYIGDISHEYFDDLERVATEERDGIKDRDNIRLELEVLKNCLEMVLPTALNDEEGAVIDIGGGNGFLISKISHKEKVLCDSSFVKLKQVSPEVVRIRVNAESMPIKSSMFNLALCTDIFEHVKDEVALSSEISRVVKEGGYLFLSVPWKQNLDVLKSPEYLEKYGSYPSGHCRSVNEKMIEECFSDFDIVSTTNLDVVRRFMEFEPYSIKLFLMQKKRS
jgi:ubiquinone/menaquinone biosynthesis C-methylase UbiE